MNEHLDEKYKKLNIRNILSKNILDYLDSHSTEIETSYDVNYNEKGVYLTRTIKQFISHTEIELLENSANSENNADLENTNNKKKRLRKRKQKFLDSNNLPSQPNKLTKNNSDKLDIICDILLNKNIVKQENNEAFHCDLINTSSGNSTSLDEYVNSSQESFLTNSAPIEQIIQNHIDKVKKFYNTPIQDNLDINFYKTVSEDTLGYIKDLYISNLINVYNKHNDINEKKVDFMSLLRKKYEFYWFSSTGSCLILFNILDPIFVSAWHDYLDYLAELDILCKTENLKGFFKFKLYNTQ